MKVKFRCHILSLVLSLLVSVLIQWCNRTSAVFSDNVKKRKRWLRNRSASSSTKLQPRLMSSVSDLYLSLNCAGLCVMQVIFAERSQPVAALGQRICSHQIHPCLLQLPLLSKRTLEQTLSHFVRVVRSGCCWTCCQGGATSTQKETHGLSKLQVDRNDSWVAFCFCWSSVGPSCVSGVMIDLAEKQRVFPSPQCSEQSPVFVFPGRAPSSASGIVHVLHVGCLLIQECGATSCAVYCF